MPNVGKGQSKNRSTNLVKYNVAVVAFLIGVRRITKGWTKSLICTAANNSNKIALFC